MPDNGMIVGRCAGSMAWPGGTRDAPWPQPIVEVRYTKAYSVIGRIPYEVTLYPCPDCGRPTGTNRQGRIQPHNPNSAGYQPKPGYISEAM